MEPKPINTRAYIAMYMHDKTIATTNYYFHSGWKDLNSIEDPF